MATVEKTENPPVYDVYGYPVAGEGYEGLIQNNLGGAYDAQRFVLQHELRELEINNVPKSEKLNTDRVCLVAAGEALDFVHDKIMQHINDIPQPTWISNETDFKDFVGQVFQAAGAANGVSAGKMDSALDTYNLRPNKASEVEKKVAQVSAQIRQMDELVNKINNQFNLLSEYATSKDDFKALSKQGITTIDGIYAIDPGRFEPKDGSGRPTQYDPKNLIHVLQAVERYMANPESAKVDGMRLFGPSAIRELRDVMSDGMPAPTNSNGLGMDKKASGIINAINGGDGPDRNIKRGIIDTNNNVIATNSTDIAAKESLRAMGKSDDPNYDPDNPYSAKNIAQRGARLLAPG